MYIYRSSCKVSDILARFYSNLHFLDTFPKNPQNIKFHKNQFSATPVVAREQTDGRADMTKLMVPFCKLCEKAKNSGWGCFLLASAPVYVN